ncbi:MAG TPA: tRNA pseudouridine(38-40) synthase TruA [Thermoanaerobaculia bacterium]|jgi:tRNA pseudouridine38-40 synthase|nr:tRNA pseudouridine(38-40) synthase TruA [Thermoanaerobaculia bacterium]
MPTYRMTLEYEGTRYHGWQEQKNARSVSGELRRAIEEAGGTVRELGASGRTDAGVHALAQVAHLRLARQVDPEPFRRAINDRLPPDVHILSLAEAADRFHSRHDAVSRSYLYQISRRRTALAKRFVWWVKRPLDEGRMAEAAALAEGRHDFRLFCERPAEQTSTLVVVEKIEVTTAGALILVRFSASHFLWKMVRRVVGTLVQLGAGELDRREFESLLAAKAPKSGKGLPAEWTAPPSGLFLERVSYKGDPPVGPVEPVIAVSEDG